MIHAAGGGGNSNSGSNINSNGSNINGNNSSTISSTVPSTTLSTSSSSPNIQDDDDLQNMHHHRTYVQAMLLADTRIELYSTDVPPFSVQLVGEDYMTQNCQCKIRDVACLTCGNVLGYHITQPCQQCMEACNNGHLWMFHTEAVTSEERLDPEGKKILLWAHLPRAEKDTENDLKKSVERRFSFLLLLLFVFKDGKDSRCCWKTKRKHRSINNDNKHTNQKDPDEPELISRKNLKLDNNNNDKQSSKTKDIFNMDKKRNSQKQSSDNSKISKGKKNGSDLIKFRKDLPIWQERNNLVQEVKKSETIIIMGEMGSGKSTQTPQFLVEFGLISSKKGGIAITQPRRVAAISLASRVSQEFGTQLGQKVGYSVRFDDKSSHSTIIKYLTDGMLLRELLSDSLLLKYSVVILDEAHERTMRTDILFGMVKRAQEIRKNKNKIDQEDKNYEPLKIIVMSATLDTEKFAKYFNTSTILKISGRQFPVTINYASEPQQDYLDAALTTTMQIHIDQPKGDILVFLPGQEDIEILEKLINEYGTSLPPDKLKVITCLLFAALPTEQQTKVFDPAPPGTRKIILATNIAETSITIRGVRYVVDTAKCKIRKFNPRIGMESLSIENISQNSADQRMGRAGREAPGICHRLFTKDEYNRMEKDTEPEIKRCNLAPIILLLKALGIDDVLGFDYLDAPSRTLLKRALEQLFILKALDSQGKITELGRKMAEFPLEPAYAKVLIASQEMSCTREAIEIVSLLSVESIFFSPQDQREHASEMKKKFVSPFGDLITYLNVLRSYEVQKGNSEWCYQNFINRRNMKHVIEVRKQLIQLCIRMGIQTNSSCGNEYEIVLKCMLCGFFRNSATLQPTNNYKTIFSNQNVNVHPSSALFNKKVEAVMYTELVLTTKPYMKNVSAIQSNWLSDTALNIQK
ncbi:ATP-dependent RNA helicase Prh1 [Rhizophagus clarus]|uniref:RNA helicase n=1 Tax=Rhizophagus clarus TaxID=94130 RepID=A0A8H3KQE4_9GLOM|nr:ATP-dependent RNA helicase Prh1 [Rhizophagus clarus]